MISNIQHTTQCAGKFKRPLCQSKLKQSLKNRPKGCIKDHIKNPKNTCRCFMPWPQASQTLNHFCFSHLLSSPRHYVNISHSPAASFPIWSTMNMTKNLKIVTLSVHFSSEERERGRKMAEGVNASLKATTKLQHFSQAVKQEK